MIEGTIDAGACGFVNKVKVKRKGLGFKVEIETKCKLVEKYADDIETLDKDVVLQKDANKSCLSKSRHTTCSMPCTMWGIKSM